MCSTYILREQTGELLLVHVDVLDESLHQCHGARDVTVSRAAGSTAVWTAVGRGLAAQIPRGAGSGPALPDGPRHVLQLIAELPATTDSSHYNGKKLNRLGQPGGFNTRTAGGVFVLVSRGSGGAGNYKAHLVAY